MKNRSCTSQLLKVNNSIGSVLNKGGQVDIVYLDYSRAFDSVSHSLLLHQLKDQFDFSHKLYKWFQDYLTNRKQNVVIDNIESDWLPFTSGVPQASILLPLFVFIVFNNMPSELDLCTTALFAVYAKCFKETKCTNDSIILQTHFDEIHVWSKRWDLFFNINKCAV